MRRTFKTREQRNAYFRALGHRTDRKVRRTRMLREIDLQRIEAGPFPVRRPLPSQPDARQARG